MRKVTKAFLLVLVIAMIGGAPTRGSQGATQLVISGGVPPGTTTGTLNNAFGIWVWCEDPSATNPYAGQCAGALYFYDLGITKHVEDEEGTVFLDKNSGFSVELVSRDGSVDCTVSGSLPAAKGPNNTISVDCSEPNRSGTLSKVVLKAT